MITSLVRILLGIVLSLCSLKKKQNKKNFKNSGLPNALVGFVREFAVEAVHLTEQAAIVGGGIISAGVQVLDVQQNVCFFIIDQKL